MTFEIATPDPVPAGYELETVTVEDEILQLSATVCYEHDEDWFTVRTQLTRPTVPDGATELSSADRTAFAFETAVGNRIAWTCDRLWYTIEGGHSADELESIVEQIPCQ